MKGTKTFPKQRASNLKSLAQRKCYIWMLVLIRHKVLRENITSISFFMGREGRGRGLKDDKNFFER